MKGPETQSFEVGLKAELKGLIALGLERADRNSLKRDSGEINRGGTIEVWFRGGSGDFPGPKGFNKESL